ncbi:hypothetical protein EFBL_1024 [Effusibacillus lacus]|uniref:Uncharacterized protein n=2 Tax=Effusibacillus lacus TaxID=1348429 RepID=A0A292YJS3_9BACL|nr:hypothetical protein EFBL_1024 [Effusibacillus lacus]
MNGSLASRCQEVAEALKQKKLEKVWYARELLAAPQEEKLICAVKYLAVELQMHQEVRSVWPYVLSMPDSSEAAFLCETYSCNLEDLGELLNTRIQQLSFSLEVLNDKMSGAASPFWQTVRDEFLIRLCEEAKNFVENQGTP